MKGCFLAAIKSGISVTSIFKILHVIADRRKPLDSTRLRIIWDFTNDRNLNKSYIPTEEKYCRLKTQCMDNRQNYSFKILCLLK